MEETARIRNINRRATERTKAGETSYFDFILLFVVIVLIAFGLVMLYSVTSYEAMNKFDDSMYYLKRQLRGVLIGAVVMAFFALVNYRRWIKWVPILYIITFLLEIAVFIGGKLPVRQQQRRQGQTQQDHRHGGEPDLFLYMIQPCSLLSLIVCILFTVYFVLFIVYCKLFSVNCQQ